jgi:hypothetical protein
LGLADIQQGAGNLALQRLLDSGLIQGKLSISQPNDPYEQEADRVAEQVMSSVSVPSIQRKCDACAAGGTCPKCDEEQKIQAKELPGHWPHITPQVESSLASLSGGSQPLPPSVRESFEPRFGADFSGVRLHTGSEAAQLNRALGAHAFTHGRDIFLGEGKNDLESSAGKQLLAHELTHTIQQGAASGNIARRMSEDHVAFPESPAMSMPVVQRQAAPAPPPSAAPSPASGATSPSPPAPAPGASKSEADPAELPLRGDAWITLTPGMSVPLELPDLREFAIGKGTLTTEPIPLGESGITAEVEVGSHNPVHLLNPSLELTAVIVHIAASLIAAKRSTKETVTKGLGIEGAAIGGIVGGLLGGFVGDPIAGAKRGGEIGGRLGEAVAGVFVGEQALSATLTSGALVGHFPLVYTPFLRVRLSVPLISKVVDVNATLQTQLTLDVAPFLSFVGSAIDLRFRDGRLTRSEFTLKVTGGLSFTLDAFGQLRLGATILSILKGSESEGAEEDPGLLTIDIVETDVFPIAEKLGGEISASTELKFLKASKLAVTAKQIKGDGGGGGSKVLVNALKGNLGKAAGGKKPSLDNLPHTGTEDDPVPMTWFKPLDFYVRALHRARPDRPGRQTIHVFPHTWYPPDDFEAGIDAKYLPRVGKKVKKTGQEHRKDGAKEFREHLEAHKINLEGADIDHVQDIAFGGSDDFANLWPLDSGRNSEAGFTQNVNQHVNWHGPVKGPFRIIDVPVGTWFVIRDILP